MRKDRLIKFVYILLRERLAFGDLEAIIAEVEAESETGTSSLVQLYVEEIVNRLTKSNLKCYNNMCNTEYDDVRLTQSGDGVGSEIPMCVDCRRRNGVVAIEN